MSFSFALLASLGADILDFAWPPATQNPESLAKQASKVRLARGAALAAAFLLRHARLQALRARDAILLKN